MTNLHSLPVLLLCFAVTLLIGCEGQEAGDTQMADNDTAGVMTPDPMMDDPMAADQTESLRTDLSGTAVVPGPGDPDGSGSATVSLDAEQGQVCYEIEVEGIADPTAAHIHTGAEGESGPPVVDFNIGENGLSACVDADSEVVQQIESSPSQYFVNIHNSEYGGGAVRGQLQ